MAQEKQEIKQKMTENIDQMRKRHKQEIETLQQNCKHKKLSGWLNEYWAIAHATGNMIKVCEFCGKIVKRKGMKFDYIVKTNTKKPIKFG
jgi:hypothetical protein